MDYWRAPDIAGFAAHWTWIWCVFWSSLFYGMSSTPGALGAERAFGPVVSSVGAGIPSAIATLEPLWAVSLSANVVAIAALLLLAHRRNPLGRLSWLPWSAAGLTCVGTLLISQVVLEAASGVAPALYLAGSVLTGIGSGAIVVLWGELLASIGSRETVRYSVMALLLAALAYVFITLLPVDVAQLVVAALPVLGVLCYRHARRGMPPLPRSLCDVRVKARPPLRMMLIALFFGASFGVMKGLMAPLEPEQIVLRDALNIVGIVVGVLALHVTTNVFKMDFSQLTYQVALPLMAAGFLFLPLQGVPGVIGTAVHQCGYQYFYIVLWATWPILAQRGGVPAGRIVAWGMLSIQFGQLVGSLAASVLAQVVEEQSGLAMFSALSVFTMLLVAIFVFANRSPETGWERVRPGEAERTMTELDDAATSLARRFRLSPREVEVLFLLAKGRNRSYIAHELAIGDETVKSHVKSLYRKMGLHSQQELIDLVEAEVGFGRVGIGGDAL